MNSFVDDVYFKETKKRPETTKMVALGFGDTWSVDLLDLNDYGPKIERGNRYILAVTDNYNIFRRIVPFRIKNSKL